MVEIQDLPQTWWEIDCTYEGKRSWALAAGESQQQAEANFRASQWIAVPAATVLFSLAAGSGTAGGSTGSWAIGLVINVLIGAVWMFAMIRFGFFAAAVTTLFLFLLANFPVAVHWNDWFIAQPVLIWCFVAAVALYGFRIALGKTAFRAAFNHLVD